MSGDAGLKSRIDADHFEERLGVEHQQVEHLKHGTHLLMVGMVSWFSALTIVSIVVFVVAYKYLGRDDDDAAANDAESVITEKSAAPTKGSKQRSKVSVIDIGHALAWKTAYPVKPIDHVIVETIPTTHVTQTDIKLDATQTESSS